ncbi:MAG: hypothetical protein J0I32_21480 [Sphingobacteriales bacterium]|nr:hypothetical protein [Sphingobacteriales bacterium]OJW02224.1 MAG: hypothetical protein BGO52_22835 [Sphingobacteriales bacterium 44-61]
MILEIIFAQLEWYHWLAFIIACAVAGIQFLCDKPSRRLKALMIVLLAVSSILTVIQTSEDKKDEEDKFAEELANSQRKFDSTMKSATTILDSVNTTLQNSRIIITSTDTALTRADSALGELNRLNDETKNINRKSTRQLDIQQDISLVSLQTLKQIKKEDSVQKINAAIRLESTINVLKLYGNQVLYSLSKRMDSKELVAQLNIVVVNMLTLLASQKDNSNLFLNPFLYKHWTLFEDRLSEIQSPISGYSPRDALIMQQEVSHYWLAFYKAIIEYSIQTTNYYLEKPFYFPPKDTSYLRYLYGTSFD